MAARWEEWEPADYGYGFFECSGGFKSYCIVRVAAILSMFGLR